MQLTPQEFDLVLTALMRSKNEHADQRILAINSKKPALVDYYTRAGIEVTEAYCIISTLEDESRRTQSESQATK